MPASPVSTTIERDVDLRELGVATEDHRTERPGRGHPGPDQARGLHGLGPAADRHRVDRLELEAAGELPRGRRPDERRAGLGQCREPRGDVGRVAERHLLAVSGADEADRRLPAVDADPHAEVRNAPRALDVAAVAPDRLEDPQRRTGGALGIVLVGDRDAEVGRDPVTLVGLHRAAEVLDGLAHARDALADQRLDLGRRQPLAEPRRADEIGEQGGDRAELVPFSRSTRARHARHRRAARRAEAAGRRQRCSADAARRLVRRVRALPHVASSIRRSAAAAASLTCLRPGTGPRWRSPRHPGRG
jgi:hypothetical protein